MNKKTQRQKYLIVDFFAGALAWFVFNILRYYEVAQYQGFNSLVEFLTSSQVVLGQVLIPFFWLILHYYSGYYNKPLDKSRLSEFFVTFQTVLAGTIILFFLVLLNELPKSFYLYYKQFLLLYLFTFTITYFLRLSITQRASQKIKRREWVIKALILGTGVKASRLKSMLEKPSTTLGYTVEGYINVNKKTVSPIENSEIHVLGGLEDLESIIKEKEIEELIVVSETEDDKELLNLLYSLYQYKLPIKLPVNSLNIQMRNVKIEAIAGTPLIDVTDNNFPEGEKNIKYTIDRLLSLFILIFLSPVYAYLIIRVKKDSQGSVFLKQERIGYLGKPFIMYKFRTMMEDAEKDGPLLSSENDSRITNYGRKMRKYRLDELPQFWNVLKGDMSLVGPRPERKYYIDRIVEQAPCYYLLHNVRPGITSWGMVKYGYASSVEQMIERMQYDMLYYENMSLLLDFKILIYTIKTIWTGKGI